MFCYECSKARKNCDAVGLCHHCSAALCAEHARIVAEPVTTTAALLRTIVLPKKARLLLCDTCFAALAQTGQPMMEICETPNTARVA